ncbi:uncharacterized protein LOC110924264 [Helianthus annuus]|uniref:uncharacterized protein LOC110924264 n=1 Tax=Helianthus annuus TaxID=4232 RepID=UPI000B9097B4|nr:uncharacterized protein LOC110924264 [Helianthus annuus]
MRRDSDVSFIAFQETQLSDMGEVDSAKFWGDNDFDMDWVAANGRSGGLLSMWDPKIFKKVETIKDQHYLLFRGIVCGSNKEINLVNVYAPQRVPEKSLLWDKILGLLNSYPGQWVIMGDFNVVRSPKERKNSSFKVSCARAFNAFINEAGLLEYEMMGRKYTFLVENGSKMSKIDRFLVCFSFFSDWPDACLRALPRTHSDHNPIVLTTAKKNFGARPFRVFNSWLDKEGYVETVEKAATDFIGMEEPPDVVLSKKFKFVRDSIKNWREVMIHRENEEEETLREELENLEVTAEVRDLEEDEVWVKAECKKNLGILERNKTRDLKQRSRIRWAIDGDENTSFFHGVVNRRKASNTIHGLSINGSWVQKPTVIKGRFYHSSGTFFLNLSQVDIVCFVQGYARYLKGRGLISNCRSLKRKLKRLFFNAGRIGLPAQMA